MGLLAQVGESSTVPLVMRLWHRRDLEIGRLQVPGIMLNET
jgi:hypothetical protein